MKVRNWEAEVAAAEEDAARRDEEEKRKALREGRMVRMLMLWSCGVVRSVALLARDDDSCHCRKALAKPLTSVKCRRPEPGWANSLGMTRIWRCPLKHERFAIICHTVLCVFSGRAVLRSASTATNAC